MKKNLIILLFALSILFIAAPAYAVDIYIDGEKLQTDAEPLIKNNRTMVPMRAIFEALGATVTYSAPKNEGEDATIWATKAHRKIGMNVSPITSFNPTRVTYIVDEIDGKETAQNNYLDSPPFIMNGRTFIPLRFVAEAFGGDVRYENNTVYITRGAMPAVGPMLNDHEKTIFRKITSSGAYKEMPLEILMKTLETFAIYDAYSDYVSSYEQELLIQELDDSFNQIILNKKGVLNTVSTTYGIENETFRRELIQILTDDLRLYEELQHMSSQLLRTGHIDDIMSRIDRVKVLYENQKDIFSRFRALNSKYGF